MFKFDFELDDVDNELSQSFDASHHEGDYESPIYLQPFSEIPISKLLDRLPSLISYSPLHVHLQSNQSLTLVRRDLFDARFQLILETGEEKSGAERTSTTSISPLEFVEAPSDLVPGIYEGGLKTWECSLDLVNYLDSLRIADESLQGKRILEIGCGTAIPSLYLLRRLFTTPPSTESGRTETQIHLQDYNASVLELVTLPNVLLTWYMSPAAASYRQTEDDGPYPLDNLTIQDPLVHSDLQITPELKSAFLSSLHDYNLSLRFFSGSWDTFDVSSTGGRYDIVLTSETIYHLDSLPSLVRLMRAASASASAGSLKLCIVAAKVIYFGVGGGISEFVNAVTAEPMLLGDMRKGRVRIVWELNVGVGRKIVQVDWS